MSYGQIDNAVLFGDEVTRCAVTLCRSCVELTCQDTRREAGVFAGAFQQGPNVRVGHISVGHCSAVISYSEFNKFEVDTDQD